LELHWIWLFGCLVWLTSINVESFLMIARVFLKKVKNFLRLQVVKIEQLRRVKEKV